MIVKLIFACAAVITASATLAASIPTSAPLSPTTYPAGFTDKMMCKLAEDANRDLFELREKQAIYQHHHGFMGSTELLERSSSKTRACAEALHKAEQYASVYAEALQEAVVVGEAYYKP